MRAIERAAPRGAGGPTGRTESTGPTGRVWRAWRTWRRGRRCVPLGLAAAAASLALACADAPPPRPNVLLVTLDTTRAGALGCYGNARPTSPNLDELAREAVVYERAYSPSSWTLPAHASLFTGKFPSSHGVQHDAEGTLILARAIAGAPEEVRARPLGRDERTLAALLQEAGWATAGVVAGPWLMRPFGFDRGFEHYDDDGIRNAAGRRAQSVTEAALAWLREPRDRPFFLFLNYFDPHAPYAPPPPYATAFLPPGVRPDPRRRDQARALYDAEVLYMDAELGRVLGHLRDTGLYESTLIVVTADHGELLGEHDEWGHERFLWEELVHVPLIVKPAGDLRRGRRERAPVQLVDVLPLILDAAGLPTPPDVQGRAPPRVRHALLAEERRSSPDSPTGDWRALWQGHTKYLRSTRGERYLFDLATDPREQHNLIDQQPERAREAAEALERAFAELPAPGPSGAPLEVDEATREALRRLGYLE